MKRAGVVLLVGAAASCSGSTGRVGPHRAERSAPAKDSPQNLALHRAAYQSSGANFDETAHLVTDGVVTDDAAKYPEGHETSRTADPLLSQWRSDAGSPQWIYVDLGAPATFDRVVLRWGALHPRA